ncbi:YwqG family protein [Flectobacillus longus]|jgi:uncharacterized protein YwqG|uniref:DUF1963 domain-containing protein n=1 Tax=Flectobacillus longus TaxID=2984207 RepID=A0ABT6YGV9_9BACT|nr:DUF1963 domain-containing protein [Flectobacillus longus]MDI9862829.1 DUF1963 domain-containing protein [Flectobacillus longus]MDI9881848.1 DUF1963 domain-containing protein [Flectobacillus longus]
MIPYFLENLAPQIESYKLDSVKILAHPLTAGQKLEIKQSKFLGLPYLPNNQKYPTGLDGTPMILLAQINFAEVPALENYPESGILQFFIHPTDWYNMSQNDYKILYHDTISDDYQTDFNFLSDKTYEESPIYCEHSLTFTKETEYGSITDFRFELDFNGLDYYDYKETLDSTQQEQLDNFFYIIGHKIGGYAFFTQSDPRDYGTNLKNDVLLLQIDTDNEIMFGDSGVANFFINIQDLKNKHFEKAYFNWDCC